MTELQIVGMQKTVYFDGHTDDNNVHVRNPLFMVCKLASCDIQRDLLKFRTGNALHGYRG